MTFFHLDSSHSYGIIYHTPNFIYVGFEQMSGNLILITGAIYLFVAYDQGYNHKNIGMLITYLGYAGANIGLYMLANK